MSTKTSAGLAQWARDAYALGWVYWYGTCGYACTQSLLNSKAKQYPAHYGSNRMSTYKKHIAQGKVCTDCIGLIKSYAWDNDGDIDTRGRTYGGNGAPDNGAATTLKKSTIKGNISTIPEIPGLLVWTKTGGHVGVYVGGGYVIEARGFSYGVQRNKLSSRSFTTWGVYPYITYTEDELALAKKAAGVDTSDPTPAPGQSDQSTTGGGKKVTIELTTLRTGSKGAEVKTLQRLLTALGYPCGATDGIFGNTTLAGVRAFQSASKLTVDGIVGKNTWTALLK